MLKIQFCHFSYHEGWCAAETSTTDQNLPLWTDGGQPRYLITRNMKTQVNSMPPIMMNLSWVARLSISLITVFDSPNMLATSSIFLWVTCVEPKQSHTHVNRLDMLTLNILGNSGIRWQHCNYPRLFIWFLWDVECPHPPWRATPSEVSHG